MSSTSVGPPVDPKWAAENNLPRLLALTGVFHIAALTSVALRLFVRLGLLRSLGKDDIAIVLAALGALGGWICFILQGNHGFGRHAKVVSKEDMEEFTHIGFFGSIISAIGALGLLKISIALFLLRLKNNNMWKWYSRCLWALIALVTIYTIGAWLSFFLYCKPMEAMWTRKGVCYSQKMFIAFALTNTALNIFTDVCFATLPIPIIWSLQMSRTTRINLIGVLSLGYIAVALGIVKASYQVKRDPDRTFNQHLNVYGFLQLNVGIIAACIPTLKPLLRSTPSSRTPRRSAYNDIEHAETIGSGRAHKPRASFLNTTKASPTTTTLTIDETFEMANRGSLRDTLAGGGGGPNAQKNVVYSGRNEVPTSSQERILHAQVGGEDASKILCTTEVVVDSVERVRRKR
ncbi:hypothetical protein COCMIDRAFT_101999 [Bipolaris oryzae ATCC 44560]|uniref:Rhodopsin domain-containing protein n=1 Tax=Bipolaris oryzae ATCC 44560 TaxID=930090 RepID=W6YU72_COCMI|nr:uncharacterized protein COCMIDRAFT_101999 [Bipolaris oryzae ATCC 44560]EUC43007.1 hypothetical protein COCMIDRAFT_101999 [Bipolaris oryzae ATCC 44560]